MENSTWSGSCPHCGCPIEGVHYEGCSRNKGKINYSVNEPKTMLNEYKERKLAEWYKICESIEANKEFIDNRYRGFGKAFISDLIDEMSTNLFLKDIVTKTRIDTLRQVLPKEHIKLEEQRPEDKFMSIGHNETRKDIINKAKALWGIDLINN